MAIKGMARHERAEAANLIDALTATLDEMTEEVECRHCNKYAAANFREHVLKLVVDELTSRIAKED